MKHGIIGCGFISKEHEKAIKKFGGELIGSYDPIATRYYTRNYFNVQDLINEADVLHICTPNVFHEWYLNLCQGKKIVVEKPILLPSEVDAAVCFQRRFNTQCQEIKALCEQEMPQQIIANIFVRRDPQYWECWRGDNDYSKGGALLNIGVHYIDLMQWWTRQEGMVIEASIDNFGHSMDLSASAELNFGSVKARLELSARYHKRAIEMIVIWKNKVKIYDVDDATHFDVLSNYLNQGIYVTPQEALKPTNLINKIYEYARS